MDWWDVQCAFLQLHRFPCFQTNLSTHAAASTTILQYNVQDRRCEHFSLLVKISHGLLGRLDPEIDWNLASMIGNELADYVDPKNLYLKFKLIVDQALAQRKNLNFYKKRDFNGQQQIVKKIQQIV